MKVVIRCVCAERWELRCIPREIVARVPYGSSKDPQSAKSKEGELMKSASKKGHGKEYWQDVSENEFYGVCVNSTDTNWLSIGVMKFVDMLI